VENQGKQGKQVKRGMIKAKSKAKSKAREHGASKSKAEHLLSMLIIMSSIAYHCMQHYEDVKSITKHHPGFSPCMKA
jgi:hypothetical protein